jgi:multidrug/hemolysin transport system ATP-binding protein
MEEAARAQHVAVIDSGRIAAYASPHELKEKYATDRIRVFSCDSEKVISVANKYQLAYKEKSNHISITVPNTISSIPVLQELKSCMDSFEVVQGTMDDVFINITGKQLQEAV